MRMLLLLIALVAGSGVLAFAGEDVAAAQSVIQSQEEAFGRDDAAAAYTFAAPSIKSWYRTPETFMSMVRNGYAPVYRHRSFEFGEASFWTARSSNKSTSSMPTASPGKRFTRWNSNPTEP